MVPQYIEDIDGEKMRQKREDAGMTQKDAAFKAPCSISILRGLETGRHKNPGFDLLVRLARLYDCMVVDFTTLVKAGAPNEDEKPKAPARKGGRPPKKKPRGGRPKRR